MSTKRTDRLTLPLNQLMSRSGDANVALAGGKGASLGKLMGAGLPVPDGYVVTTNAYLRFIHQTGLYNPICDILDGLDVHDNHALATAGSQIRQLILDTPMPKSLSRLIRRMYRKLGSGPVGVRSSTSAEDGDTASYAGQQDTHLYITGASNVVTTVKMCFSSLWTDRAILYSTTKGINHLDVSMAVVVQNMVSADEGVAGVMFTIDPNSGHPGMIDIGAVRGLGEGIVGGLVSGDDFLVSKASLLNGGNGIVHRNLGSKKVRVVRDVHGTRVETVPEELQGRYCLTDDQVREIARIGIQIENYYGKPMDVEWAIDKDGVLWILQARPETVASKATQLRSFSFKTPPTGKVIARGVPVGNMIGSGLMFFVDKPTPEAIATFPQGAILVAMHTDPTWLPIMLKAGGFVTIEGSRTSHVAIVAREMNKPAIVGVSFGATELRNGNGSFITVSCADGQGIVYEGEQPFEVTEIDPSTLPTTKTRVMLNLADPNLALERSQIPNDGVGLLRMEFIIANTIGLHPMALLNWPNLDNPDDIAEIARRTAGFSWPEEYFVDTLAEGVAMICAAVWPHPVILRTSDFKTNEYRALIGGAQFEQFEENPMMGWRGCDRHIDPRYAPAFALECEAIRRVREDMRLTNLHVMLPFIRTPERGRQVIEAMTANGIPQGHNGMKVYAMIELPTNALRAAEYAKIFDGFSIGSNDLTQLTVGVDRDSGDPILVEVFDEMDPAVLALIDMAIKAAHDAGIPCGICGQGPSDRPELAAWLVEHGIDSMSVLPDAVIKTRQVIHRIESQRVLQLAG